MHIILILILLIFLFPIICKLIEELSAGILHILILMMMKTTHYHTYGI